MKIDIIHHCFGLKLSIDGIDIFTYKYDEQEINKKLINIILNLFENLTLNDEEISYLAEAHYILEEACSVSEIVDICKNNLNEISVLLCEDIIEHLITKYKADLIKSERDICEQCGNYNTTEKYYLHVN